jgi:predicted transcriptional regulator
MALTLRTDEQTELALTELSNELGVSRQEIIRRAILELHERTTHRALVEGATSEMMDRWSDVLRRLGTE